MKKNLHLFVLILFGMSFFVWGACKESDETNNKDTEPQNDSDSILKDNPFFPLDLRSAADALASAIWSLDILLHNK